MIATESCFAQAALSIANTLDTLAHESCGTFAPQLQLASTAPRVRGTLWPCRRGWTSRVTCRFSRATPILYPTLTSKDATRWREGGHWLWLQVCLGVFQAKQQRNWPTPCHHHLKVRRQPCGGYLDHQSCPMPPTCKSAWHLQAGHPIGPSTWPRMLRGDPLPLRSGLVIFSPGCTPARNAFHDGPDMD